jgi:hypothetical protein
MTAARTYSAVQNVVVTWTARLAHRPPEFAGGWLGFADALGHKLHLPRWIMRPICDLYDIEVGIPKEDLIRMDYTMKGLRTPWWLR